MKNKLTYAAGFAFLLLMGVIFGCTTDGKDGNVYITYTWSESDGFSPVKLTVSQTDIPNPFDWNVEYQTHPQTVSYNYYYSDGTTYSGEFILTINPGGKKSFFSNGKDGADKHAEFVCSYYGSTFYGGANAIIEPHPTNTAQEGSVTMRDGDYTWHLTYKRSQLSPQQMEQLKSASVNPLQRQSK